MFVSVSEFFYKKIRKLVGFLIPPYICKELSEKRQ